MKEKDRKDQNNVEDPMQEKSKKLKRKKTTGNEKFQSVITALCVGAIVGFVMGIIGIDIGDHYIAQFTEVQRIVLIWLGVVILMISYLLHILIHEGGHMVFGLISGYQFLSYRIGSFTLVRKEGKLQWKRFSIPGTAGQCLMIPPVRREDGTYPSVLYNLGGVLMNFITALLALLIFYQVEDTMAAIVFLIFAVVGILVGLMNGIPLKISGMANDGYNIYSLKRDELGARAFYQQLYVNAKISEGYRYHEIPQEEIFLKEINNYRNPLLAAAKLNEYNWYLDQFQFEQASVVLEELENEMDNYIPIVRNIVHMERLFLTLITTKDESVIASNETKELKVYMKQAKFDCAVKRVMYTKALFEKKTVEAQKCMEELEKLVLKSPVQGEAKLNLLLADCARQRLSESEEADL